MVGGFSLPASADRGKPAERVWMSGESLEAISTELRAGSEVCVGTKRNHACSRINPFTGEALIQDVSRPIGANKNVVINTIVVLTPEGVVMRREDGVLVARFQVGSENANWQATLQSAFPAVAGGFTNGLGAAVVQTVANPCGNGGCGGGPTAIAISDSAAQSIANTLVQGSAGCYSGSPCTAPAPTHPQN
jgi:hypothetical protein